MSKNEREDRALDALIVSQLRRNDETDVEHLPRLTEDEKAALDSLGPAFVDRLFAEETAEGDDQPDSEGATAFTREEMLAGMNRAEDIDDETAEELEKKRKEIIDRVKREEEEGE